MNKLMIVLMAAVMWIAGNAQAADNGGLPEIAAYEDEAYDMLPDMVAAGGTDEMSAADDSGMPEIAAYDDDAYDLLPDMVSAQ